MKRKQQETKKKPFWKKPLLITKKTITQDPKDPSVQWVELDLYNPYKDKKNKTFKSFLDSRNIAFEADLFI